MNSNFNQDLAKSMVEKQKKQSVQKPVMVAVPYKRFDKSLPGFFKEDEGNAGFDMFARLSEPVTLQPGEVQVIPLNVATQIPAFAVGLLFQRSSTYRKWKVRLTNNVGVIDSLFAGPTDEWGAEFQNMSSEPITISNGDKICQAVFLPLLPINLVEQDEFNTTDRGGFGTSFDNANALGDK